MQDYTHQQAQYAAQEAELIKAHGGITGTVKYNWDAIEANAIARFQHQLKEANRATFIKLCEAAGIWPSSADHKSFSPEVQVDPVAAAEAYIAKWNQ